MNPRGWPLPACITLPPSLLSHQRTYNRVHSFTRYTHSTFSYARGDGLWEGSLVSHCVKLCLWDRCLISSHRVLLIALSACVRLGFSVSACTYLTYLSYVCLLSPFDCLSPSVHEHSGLRLQCRGKRMQFFLCENQNTYMQEAEVC